MKELRHIKTIIIIIIIMSLTACRNTAVVPNSVEYEYNHRVSIKTLNEHDLTYSVDYPLGEGKHPILLVVDGSGCLGPNHTNFDKLFRPDHDSLYPYAKVFVDKYGVASDANDSSNCSDKFLKHYSIDQRVFDHMRALQHISKHSDWWNGKLYIWGWSDGGDIAAQLTAYYPNVTKAVLGAMGGGYTMEEHFKNFWICADENFTGDDSEIHRQDCVDELTKRFQNMQDNPTWKTTWSGHDNSWKVWSTRLFSRLSHILKDNDKPILIVHGAKDFNSTPVASARKLVEELKGAENSAYTYWEIPDMEHSMRSLPDEKNALLEKAMLDWLFSNSTEKQPLPEGLK